MKKLLLSVVLVTTLALTSCQFDDSNIWNTLNEYGETIKDHEERITALEELCKQMNTNISSLQTIVEALEKRDYVTNVSEVRNNGVVIGYTISFAYSDTITIYHGQDGANGADGKDGYTPIIGVAQDSDGIYYWTLDGKWLTDVNGNKIKAIGVDGEDGKDGADGADGKDGEDGKDGADGADGKDGEDGKDGANGADGKDGEDGKDGINGEDGQDGKDGITPQLKIENDYWYISYDNGKTWTKLGKATGEDGADGKDGEDGADGADGKDGVDGAQGPQGAKGERGDSFFLDVSQDDEYVYLTLANGTLISIPRQRPFTITFATDGGTLAFDEGESIAVNYTLSYGYNNTEVRVVGNGGWDTSVTRKSNTTGTITITAPTVNSDAEVVVLATDGIGHSTMATLVCSVTNSGSMLTVVNEVINVTEAATQVQVELQTNIDSYEVVIPTSAKSWITLGSTTTRAALREDVIKLNISENTGTSERMAAVGIINSELGINESVLIKQQRGILTQTITYTSSDESIVKPYNEYAFGGANIVSNTYSNGKGKIVFDGDITTIGFNAFYNCTALTSIELPDKVSTIEEYAFAGCTALTNLDFGVGVKSIATLAFQNCTAIKTLTIPDNITSIATGAFSGCKFTTLNIGDGITTISSELFSGMTSLQLINFGTKLKTIGTKAFYGCSALRLSNIPTGVTTIEPYAFYGCKAISYLTIPEGLTAIGNDAFNACTGLVNVTLPSTVTNIGANAFSDCTKLAVVNCNATTPPTIGTNVFAKHASDFVIYIAKNSISKYCSTTNWKSYSIYITYEGGSLTYRTLGELVTTEYGDLGIVFYVSDSTIKIVSVKETSATWYNAKTWCSSYGTGWYLPTKSELLEIYNNKSTINSTLSANGYTTLGTGYYWSSTEYNSSYAYLLNFSNGHSDYYDKDGTSYVRAILAF